MGRIDPATGRNKRDKSPVRSTHGGPKRTIGTAKIENKAKLQHQRDRKTGKK